MRIQYTIKETKRRDESSDSKKINRAKPREEATGRRNIVEAKLSEDEYVYT